MTDQSDGAFGSTGAGEALLALAERCEKARIPLPDRILNRDIARAVGWGYQKPSETGRRHPAWFHPDDCRIGVVVLDSLHGTDVWREPMDYVGSLDAAMTLVPEGDWEPYGGAVSSYNVVITTAYNSVGVYPTDGASTGMHDKRGGRSVARSVPLALCAAALRARAAIALATGAAA